MKTFLDSIRNNLENALLVTQPTERRISETEKKIRALLLVQEKELLGSKEVKLKNTELSAIASKNTKDTKLDIRIEKVSSKLKPFQTELDKAKEKIIAKFKVGDNTAEDICTRLISSHHLSKVKGDEFAHKMNEAVDSITAFGSAPQFYKDDPGFKRGEDAKNFVKFLFTDSKLGSEMMSFKLIKALLVKKDEFLLKKIVTEFESMGNYLVNEMNKKVSINHNEQMLTEMLVGNMLAIYTFLDAQDGNTFKVPQFIDNKWHLVDYKVERLPLTPPQLGDKAMYAYGLSSDNTKAPPLLLFMGTPPPTVSGAKLAEWVDLAPGYAVGEIAFEYAEASLKEWMVKANKLSDNKVKVQCYGQSLGGSLSLKCASKYPELVGKVYAYNPPAPTQKILDEYGDNTQKIDNLPEVNVFTQKNDLVSFIGKGWHSKWNVFRVVPKEKNPSSYLQHIKGNTGTPDVLVHKVNVKADAASKERRIVNKIADVLRSPIFRWKTASLRACSKSL